MTARDSKLWIHKAVQICWQLGLNKNRPADFKLAYDIAVIIELAE